ncbi:redoxin domain-containing protein [Gammaproteobacteria bacterium]|nr:redoxin domain-containing protein [Gammaproteobacteria bacterium]
MKNYNYDEFSSNTYNLDDFGGPEVGTKAPNFSLSGLDNKNVQLLDFTGDFLVLELGSITCPLFQGRRKGMRDLVSKFPSVSFSILYVREAHPGVNFPAHKSLDEKTACAQQLKFSDEENRNIIIDDIDGTAHASYGGYPNSIFIIDKNRSVVFRSDWNNVSATKAALNSLLRGEPIEAKSYFLPVSPAIAIKTLKRSGKGAIKEFLMSLPTLIWKNAIRRNVLLLLNSK